MKRREDEIRAEDAGHREESERLSTREYEKKKEMARLKNEHEAVANQINEMKNVREEKLNKLRERARDAYQAIEWLNKNRAHFKGQVFEPMFLLVRSL